MSMRPQAIPPVPEEIVRVARLIRPQGNRDLLLRDELGAIYQDEQFQTAYPTRGQAAAAPWRLALVSVMQYMENYTDRQAAEVVRVRMDWTDALRLDVRDPVDGARLCLVGAQRVAHAVDGRAAGRRPAPAGADAGSPARLAQRARPGQPRTDARHGVAALRTMHRLEGGGERGRAALTASAAARGRPAMIGQATPPSTANWDARMAWPARLGRGVPTRPPTHASRPEARQRWIAVDEATQLTCQRQSTAAFNARYALQAGVEGMLSQGVRAVDRRAARSRGSATTPGQHRLTAAALTRARLLDWILPPPRPSTPTSRFAALAS